MKSIHNNPVFVSVLSLSCSIFFIILCSLNAAFSLETFAQKIIVNSSELTIIPVNPALFNWDKTPGSVNEIEYTARISQAPDLPEWFHYTYEGFNSVGYIYGVPPKSASQLNLDVIAWNHYDNYDVRRLVISMDILKKDPLEFVAELKIDNLNVRDLCNPRRMQILLNVFKEQLSWTQIDGSLVLPTYLASAVETGENRVPLRPNDAEGIIIHLSSDQDFSPELKKLQIEVSSLWKMRPCPRDMKRTSMERHFRRHNFLVDWCSFRLTTVQHWNGDLDHDEDGEGNEDSEGEGIPEEDLEDGSISVNENAEQGDDQNQKTSQTSKVSGQQKGVPEIFKFKDEIPDRGYGLAALFATLIPGSIGGLVGFLLIALLWVDRDDDSPICSKNRSTGGSVYEHGGQESEWDRPSSLVDNNIIIVTRPDHFDPLEVEEERSNLMSTPLPPQYGETHFNGTPALTYAV